MTVVIQEELSVSAKSILYYTCIVLGIDWFFSVFFFQFYVIFFGLCYLRKTEIRNK